MVLLSLHYSLCLCSAGKRTQSLKHANHALYRSAQPSHDRPVAFNQRRTDQCWFIEMSCRSAKRLLLFILYTGPIKSTEHNSFFFFLGILSAKGRKMLSQDQLPRKYFINQKSSLLPFLKAYKFDLSNSYLV